MKDVLVIKTEALVPRETMNHYQRLFAEQLKTGVVLIPAFFEAKILSCPDDVEVIIESPTPAPFLDKELNMPQ